MLWGVVGAFLLVAANAFFVAVEFAITRVPGAQLIAREGRAVVAQGEAPLHLVGAELGLDFDGANEATTGGNLLRVLGRVPEKGEVVELDGHCVRIVAVGEAEIEAVRIEPPPERPE